MAVTTHIVKRFCSGLYDVTSKDAPGRSVTVTYYSPREGASFSGWIARAEWDSYLYTDPCQTKRDAIAAAVNFLAD